jgi:hypothetical protein
VEAEDSVHPPLLFLAIRGGSGGGDGVTNADFIPVKASDPQNLIDVAASEFGADSVLCFRIVTELSPARLWTPESLVIELRMTLLRRLCVEDCVAEHGNVTILAFDGIFPTTARKAIVFLQKVRFLALGFSRQRETKQNEMI